MTTFTVPPRFRGPAASGNGGWSAGTLVDLLAPGTTRVLLRRPPPLDVALDVTVDGGTGTARHGDDVVLEAAPAEANLETVEAVDATTARAAEARYAGLSFHPFPTCFVCGTDRADGDGLRIFPGRVDDDSQGRVRVAATWTPHPSVADGDEATVPVTWAALDCVGGWAGDLAERLMVLGTMTAVVDALPVIGEEHVVVGVARGSEGRKTFTASTLYDAAGRAIAVAEHVWISVAADFV